MIQYNAAKKYIYLCTILEYILECYLNVSDLLQLFYIFF